MNKPPITNAGASLTDEQIAQAVPLLAAGVSVRALATALGCSKHAASLLIDAHHGRERAPRTKKPKASKPELSPAAAPPMPPWAGVTAALAPRAPAPASEPFEDLKSTRQGLKAQLDAAVQRGDHAATSAFSLALHRLEPLIDPGALRTETAEPNLGLLPDGIFDLIQFAVRTVTPKSDGGQLSDDDQIKAAFFFEGFEALSRMFEAQKPVRGMPIALTFCTPDALIFRSENAREKPGTVGARIQDARAEASAK